MTEQEVTDREAMESMDRERKELIGRGFTPHIRPVPLTGGEEEWWDWPRPAPTGSMFWATAVIVVTIAAFFLVLAKGWPV